MNPVFVPRLRRYRYAPERRMEAFLERELGRDVIESVFGIGAGIRAPVAIAGTPAAVYGDRIVATKRGNFDALFRRNLIRRLLREQRGTGFSSLSDLIASASSSGQGQSLMFEKTSTVTGSAVGVVQSLWNVGALPAAGANASNVPGGTGCDNTTTGGLKQNDPAGSDTLHFVGAVAGGPASGGLLLYDRLIAFLCSEGTANNAVSGTQTRYDSNTPSDPDYARGNFIMSRVTTTRSANSNTVTITYVDQDGNTAEAGAAKAMASGAVAGRHAFAAQDWFYPLNSADVGLRNITNITYSGTSSGVIEWEIGHPLAILPVVAGMAYPLDGINSDLSLKRIEVDACLALMEWNKSQTAVQTYRGLIRLVSG